MEADPADPLRQLIGGYDLVFTYGGGQPVRDRYLALGARRCVPIYNAFDPATHHRVPAQERFRADLALLANRLPDREERVDEFFVQAAALLPSHAFLLGGNGWDGRTLPDNVRYLGHVGTATTTRSTAQPRAVLNVTRESMAANGWSPATRVFEAAGAGACLITDAWEGIEDFFVPGAEVLVAQDGAEVAAHVAALDPVRSDAIGAAARAAGPRLPRLRAPRRRSSTRSLPRGGAMTGPMRVVILGLSITSSWGNGHATTFRGLVRGLVAAGHEVLFLERDVPWYAAHRDLPGLPFGRVELYGDRRARRPVRHRRAPTPTSSSSAPTCPTASRWRSGCSPPPAASPRSTTSTPR